jgi:hypothetical protein
MKTRRNDETEEERSGRRVWNVVEHTFRERAEARYFDAE